MLLPRPACFCHRVDLLLPGFCVDAAFDPSEDNLGICLCLLAYAWYVKEVAPPSVVSNCVPLAVWYPSLIEVG